MIFSLITWGESRDKLRSLKIQISEKYTVNILLEIEFKMEQRI